MLRFKVGDQVRYSVKVTGHFVMSDVFGTVGIVRKLCDTRDAKLLLVPGYFVEYTRSSGYGLNQYMLDEELSFVTKAPTFEEYVEQCRKELANAV